MSHKWLSLRSRSRLFWAAIYILAMPPFAQFLGLLLFEIAHWHQYGVWLNVPTVYIFDGSLLYRPDEVWAKTHPFLNWLDSLPIVLTTGLAAAGIIALSILSDEWIGSRVGEAG